MDGIRSVDIKRRNKIAKPYGFCCGRVNAKDGYLGQEGMWATLDLISIYPCLAPSPTLMLSNINIEELGLKR